jgi:hypothetical protein
VDSSAFHLYAGKIGAVSAVHDAHPDKNLYFTEQWIGAPGHLGGRSRLAYPRVDDRRNPQLEPHGARLDIIGKALLQSEWVTFAVPRLDGAGFGLAVDVAPV